MRHYINIFILIYFRIFRNGGQIHGTQRQKNQRTATNIFFAIVIMFLVCHLPRTIFLSYESPLRVVYKCPYHLHDLFPFWIQIVKLVGELTVTINSSLNFFIYFFSGTKFRSELYKYFRKVTLKSISDRK